MLNSHAEAREAAEEPPAVGQLRARCSGSRDVLGLHLVIKVMGTHHDHQRASLLHPPVTEKHAPSLGHLPKCH